MAYNAPPSEDTVEETRGTIGWIKALRPRRAVRRALVVLLWILVSAGLLAEAGYAVGRLLGCFSA